MGDISKTHRLTEGDLVIVVGITIQNQGSDFTNRMIAEIVAVGEADAFLKCIKSQRVFKRPLQNCYKIPDHDHPFAQVVVPKLGDLVFSFTGNRFTKEKKVVGILIEIIDKPPDELECRILSGDETHVVPLGSLIVLEGR